jgi:hypothetical protein
MIEVSSILHNCTPKSLLILDEVGGEPARMMVSPSPGR